MKHAPLAASVLLIASAVLSQTPGSDAGTVNKVVCEETSQSCSHKLVNGLRYESLTTQQAVVTVSIADNGRYTRLEVAVANLGQAPFDVIPAGFLVEVTAPKAKTLRFVPPEKIVSSDRHRAGWANALNAMGAGMATQQVTTQTNTSGTVQATGNDGSYANGTYNGNSTSTTSVPDYAAQTRARENITRRRAALAASQAELEQTVLRANTVDPGKLISGFVFFESEKRGEMYLVDLAINGVVYEFAFARPKR